MGCVNKSTKEFKVLAEYNGVSVEKLELITHKYWMESATEDYFPSEVYIKAQLGEIPYEEKSKSVRELWKQSYNTPQEFNSIEEVRIAKQEALKFFPEEAVVYYSNNKGGYTFKIRRPVSKQSVTIQNLLGERTYTGQELYDYDLITKNLGISSKENSTFASQNSSLEADVEIIDEAAKSGTWNKEALETLNNLTKNIQNGKVTYQRYPGRVHEAYKEMAGNKTAGAWLLFTRDGRTMEEKSRTLTPKERYAREEEDAPKQEKALENWAKAAGVWYKDASVPVKGMEHKENLDGGESEIYVKDAHTYRKLIHLDYFITPQLMLDRIVLHNAFSPAQLTLQGFTRNENGDLLFVVDQQFVEGTAPTDAEIADFAAKLKLKKHPRISGNTYLTEDGTVYLSDLHDENVIKNSENDLIIIDVEARLNTPELGKEGTYVPSNQLQYRNNGSQFDDLQMAIATPQTFTFKDGTTVKAPFKPNFQQVDALNAMADFVDSDKTSMTLSGYAGTGKTSLMEMLAEKMRKQHKRIMFCASTNKATAVLKERVSKAGFEAQTLNKVFGIQVEVDPTKAYNAKNLINKLKDVAIPYGTTIIIDEASMINDVNYDILNRIAKEHGLKIIYVGDAAQLAPVNQNKISKVFRNNDGEVRTLSIVERTGDNAILKEATALRENKPLSGESSFNDRGQGVAYIKPSNKTEKDAVIAHFVPGLKDNPNFFRILARTNAAVSAYNTQVRNLLGYNDPTPRVGEPITGYANWGYVWQPGGKAYYRFINSEAYKVVAVQQPRNTTQILPEVGEVTLEVIPITLEDSFGERREYNLIDIKENKRNREIAFKLAKAKSELHNKANRLSGRAQTPYRQAANAIEEFLFVNDDLGEKINNEVVTYQNKVFDFGYAMTTHKSQGSTFTHVLMDDVDISRADSNNNAANAFSNVDLGETAFQDYENTQISNEEDIDLGLDFSEGLIQEAPADNTNIANIRQQLKYVAVSRATDTVTIIANNVKKEDTPLNHLSKEAAAPKAEVQRPVTDKKPLSTLDDVYNFLKSQYKENSSEAKLTELVFNALRSNPNIKFKAADLGEGVSGRFVASEHTILFNSNPEYIQSNTLLHEAIHAVTSYYLRAENTQDFSKEVKVAIREINECYKLLKQDFIEEWKKNGVDLDESSFRLWTDSNDAYGLESAEEMVAELGKPEFVKRIKDFDRRHKGKNIFQRLIDAVATLFGINKSYGNLESTLKNAVATLLTNPNRELMDRYAKENATIKENFKKLKESNHVTVQLRRKVNEMVKALSNDTNPDIVEYADTQLRVDEDSLKFLKLPENVKIERLRDLHQGTIFVYEDYLFFSLNGEIAVDGNEAVLPIRVYSRAGLTLNKFNIKRDSNGLDYVESITPEFNTSAAFQQTQQQIVGENISSKGSDFAKRLTNPFNNETVEFRGTKFDNAEHAYQTWKSGKFDQKGFDAHGGKVRGTTDYSSNYQTMVEILTAKLQQHPDLVEGIAERGGEAYLKASTHDVVGDKYWETKAGQNKFIEALIEAYNTINQNNNRSNNKIEYGNDFRRVQETVRKGSQGSSVSGRNIPLNRRQGLANVLRRELGSIDSFAHGSSRNVTNQKHGTSFILHSEVDPQLFHDIFEVVRYYTDNGELVDLHDDYTGCKCFLTEDGTAGFAIEPDGNLISVFNLGTTKGFLSAVKDTIIEAGATHLDAFASSNQNLRLMYEKLLGAKVASSMDYNMEFDHDNIAKNHGNPEVVFMVLGKAAEREITEKHFKKDQYNEAVQYQQDVLNGNIKELFNVPSSTEVVTKDVDKPWRNDPSKSNKTRRVYLKGKQDKGYFEVVKDLEDNFYSVHFKPTDNNNPNAFTQEEKEILFQAVADIIPEGAELSTWGELSRGGVAGLNRFARLGFVQTGIREVKMKSGEPTLIPIFKKQAETPYPKRISLPGYEYFTESMEDTLIDAEWKYPLLYDLDNQLSTENTEQQNNDIIAQMERILEVTDESDLYGPMSKKQEEVVNKKLSNFGMLNKQVNNLYESNLLPASEITHTAELIMNAVSDDITKLQQEKGLAEKLFPSLKTELDFQNATRKEIIDAVGIGRLLERAKQLFDIGVMDFDDPMLEQQAEVILDNWDAVVAFGTKVFAMNEGFGIKMNYEKGGYETTNGMKLGFDDYNSQQDLDSLREQVGDEQEHWQIEQRTLDILNSASELVRMAIHDCYKVDREGKPVISKWGIRERVNPKEAITSILSWTQGALSLEDMVQKLSEKQEKNKWLSQLITRLSDTSGKEADFQSQFFGTMCKPFQSYSIVILENGTYKAVPVNEHPALSDIMQTISANLQLGEHPLFTQKDGKTSIDAKMLGNDTTTNKEADFNLHKALTELKVVVDHLKHNEELSSDLLETAINNISATCTTLGYSIPDEVIEDTLNRENIISMTQYLGYIVDTLNKEQKYQKENASKENYKAYNPFAFKGRNSIGGTVRNFLTPITDVMDEVMPNVVYDDGKLYQAYVTPSYLTLLLEKFHWDDQKFNEFKMKEYGYSEWFKRKGTGPNAGWRGDWIRRLMTDPEARRIFDHKVELNFNKRRYMKNMSDAEYTMSVITHYFTESADEKQSLVPAWFRMPMQSNKPSSEYIRFYSYRGDNYKTAIVEGMYEIFLQELDRIQTVRMRNFSKNDPDFIKNFDSNGRQFSFLPFLNQYLDAESTKELLKNEDGTPSVENSRLATLLQKRIESTTKLTAQEASELNTLIKKAIRNYMENRTQEILFKWEKKGLLEAAKNVEGIGKEDDIVRSNIENFIWNDKFASLNILQLTIGDIAAYKDAEDLQKRLAQLHAPGIRANIKATDYEGRRVSDGTYRTLILQDFDSFMSNVIENIKEVFERKIAAAPDNQKAAMKALMESLVGENGEYRKINVADAQGYSSPSSYRKKALMFGKWSRKAEELYQKLMNGEYNMTDLQTAFQPLKPFVYSQLHKDMGVSGAPISKMPMPFQAKNAEYLLIMADALTRNESLSRPNLLRAVYRVMEDSELLNPTKGIDTVQFESAIKSGLQGKINIHQFKDTVGGEDAAYAFMMNQIYLKDAEGNLTKQYNTQTFVHETSYDSYCLQQEVPEHFKNHQQAHGSQERMIIPSDLDFYKDPNGSKSEDNINYYEWTDHDGTKHKLNAKEFRQEYEETIADSINLSIEKLRQELKLDSGSRKEQNIALSEILQREILDSPRYGIDMFQACSIDEETGEFRIPKGDPIQAKRIEQLINSIIKNRINKQEIAGGPIVQVSNFGTSKQLNIRFNARSGGLLMLESEFKPTAKYKTYEEYKKAEQAGIAYFEVFVPMWADEIFKKFTDKDGNIDVTTLELIDPDLLKMISYRIPTEDKYSIAPMKVVGFMPKEAGDAIMFPYELTSIDDSDFDVDKRYVMRKDIQIVSRVEPKENETMTEAEKSYIEHNRKSLVKEIIKKINLTGNATAKEREIAEKEAEAEAKIKRGRAERIHQQNLDKIEIRNTQAEEAISNAKYSKDEEKDFDIYDKKAEKLEKSYNKAIEKENDRYQLELDKIEAQKMDDFNEAINKLQEKKVKDKIYEFLEIDRWMPAASDDALTRAIRKAYLQYMYHTVQDANGKVANDNKIIDMTWAVLTNEMTASQILNPGGFAAPKRTGYMIEAYKNSDKSWAELQSMSTDELKELSYVDKDLTWIDTQVQFYKQNAAAASLIGVFAVNKVAHAILEGNGLKIDINEICGDNAFKIADTTFDGKMEVDIKYDQLGNLVGKTLASMVSASADAVKDPILNLMNVNMTTAGMLNTMLRLGMPFDDAALFLSQNIITEILDEFNRENLTNYEPLSNIIEKRLAKYREEHKISEDATINTEPISREALIEGLKNTEHEATDYKVLLAFQKLKSITDAMRKPTFVTRFNSISSAVGPLIIDNLILEHKMEQFRLGDSKSTYFYDAEGNPVDISDVLAQHPILNAFSEAVNIARRMFYDMPAGSVGFRKLLEKLPAEMADRFYNDKKLLSDLSNFYQSYMLIEGGLINPGQLKRYIDNFPKWFSEQNFKEKYQNNLLIQNLKPLTSKKTGRTFLNVNITGEDETKKDAYRSAWIDLHKENPELSQMLFNYFFFRAGIGFSPKTGMALVPNFVKERLTAQSSQGQEISYVDIYRHFPSMEQRLEIIIDQFIRNNWNESKLVPKKGGKDTHYKVDLKEGKLYVTNEQDLIDLKGVIYMRVKTNGQTYLWKLLGEESDRENQKQRIYVRVKPLGDNNEYIEMSRENITKPMSETTLDVEDTDTAELEQKSPQESDANEDTGNKAPSEAEETRSLSDFAEALQQQWDSKGVQYTKEKVDDTINGIKSNPKLYAPFLVSVFERMGITVNREEAIKEFKKLC